MAAGTPSGQMISVPQRSFGGLHARIPLTADEQGHRDRRGGIGCSFELLDDPVGLPAAS